MGDISNCLPVFPTRHAAYIEARAEGEMRKMERYIQKRHLIVVDELGNVPLGHGRLEHLFGFFSQCYETTSVIVTPNLPFNE